MNEVSIQPAAANAKTVRFAGVMVGYIPNSPHTLASFCAYPAFYRFGPTAMKQILEATTAEATLINVTRRLMS